jgi:cereblon
MFDAAALAHLARARFLLLTGAGQSGDGRGCAAVGGDSRPRVVSQATGARLQSPVDFSYWLSWNMMVSASRRQRFLECSSTVERLRLQLDILQRMGFMACRRCQLQICHQEQLFHMSAEGPVSAFVNPGGVVHETATFYKATNLVLVGGKSEEHSWFPGYAWTIAACARCNGHIGWRFTAVKNDSVPKYFWGLSRATLKPVLAEHQEDGDG